jgi:hypothetical protein
MTSKCPICSHSRAAHVDGVKCALCRCTSEPREFRQESFAFKTALPVSVITNTRKR